MNYKADSKFLDNLYNKLSDLIPNIIQNNIKDLNINNLTKEIVETLKYLWDMKNIPEIKNLTIEMDHTKGNYLLLLEK